MIFIGNGLDVGIPHESKVDVCGKLVCIMPTQREWSNFNFFHVDDGQF